jgi:pyruvate/2-oxoglutarate dehydrogenase complex dihydrolipoamide acyltransferase (E2) component
VTVWAGLVAAFGTVGMVLAGVFAARATKQAAAATAEATQAAARVQAEPNQRAEDRAAFEAIKKELREDLTATRDEVKSLRSLVRAFAWYVGELTSQMREHRIEPPAPPERVDEYNRSGV